MTGTAKGKVDIRKFGPCEFENGYRSWPKGEKLTSMMGLDEKSDRAADEYWQACARWALLSKYNIASSIDPYQKQDDGTYKLVLNDDQIREISSLWESCIDRDGDSDLSEFLKTANSNARPLQWSLMSCGPGCQFKLHAHPNIELVYCVEGQLHEVRMDGDPLPVESSGVGPSVTSLHRSWSFATLQTGQWLVNEVGSIHKSFTSTSGDGCVLLVLWGGGHADIAEEPSGFEVGKAVDQMDAKLCQCNEGEILQETFLPNSERSRSN